MRVKHNLERFFRWEAASGILLVIATILAMIAENSPGKAFYDALLGTVLEVRIDDFRIEKPLLLWINDGLMAIFFLIVGLELKREVLEGELRNRDQVVLPALAAIGGMVLPAIIYVAINWGDSTALGGWAIPVATDIAFALGVLSLLGSRVPSSLKLFLLALAIIDDLGAVIIIALFYTDNLSVISLLIAAGAIGLLWLLNWARVISVVPYLLVGVILWMSLLKSGVHATLGGVVLALFIPLKVEGHAGSPLRQFEHDLHPTVAFFILPLFAFANTGISLAGFGVDALLRPIPLGIAAGLLIGKQLGVFGATWCAVKLGIAKLPKGADWCAIYGVSALCGIGFTMSLFISSLAFETRGGDYNMDDRLGILSGSLLSALIGYFVLRFCLKEPRSGG